MDPEQHHILEATSCKRCIGSCYQSPPISFAGSLDSPFLVFGQNPGHIQESDEMRLWWAEELNGKLIDATTAKMWYDWDYGTSWGQERLSILFGGDQHNLGYCFSNAVRCRTENNSRPPDEMIYNCTDHTKELVRIWSEHHPDPKKRVIVAMGAIARWQLFGAKADAWGKIGFQEEFGHTLSIQHYSSWKGSYSEYKLRIEELKALISVTPG